MRPSMCCAEEMGLDLRCIAVPLDAEPVRAIRADPELWACASELPPFCPPWGNEALPAISRALVAVLPAHSSWVGHFGRSFQQAEYLLDPVAYRSRVRTWEQREQTMSYRIVFGAERFTEHAISGQGIPWRCSTTAFLAAAEARIDELDVAAIRREFSVAEMDSLGLYKVHADERDDEAFARVLSQLRVFSEHCRTIVAQQLDLIITLY